MQDGHNYRCWNAGLNNKVHEWSTPSRVTALVSDAGCFCPLSPNGWFPPPIDVILSCYDCLEDKREDYQNGSVLYCVPQLYTFVSSYYRCAIYRDCCFRFSSGRPILCFCVFYLGPVCLPVLFFCVFVCYLLFVLSCQYQCKWFSGKTGLQNDLLCVERWGVNSILPTLSLAKWTGDGVYDPETVLNFSMRFDAFCIHFGDEQQ